MRIVIATGIYPPDIGGPALYAQGVKHALENAGHIAPVVQFGTVKSWPTGLRHVLYALKLLAAARKADAIIVFDTYSTGVPATLVGLILRIPVVIRVGGDFVWEAFVERTEKLLPLPHFYQQLPSLSLKERVAFYFVRWMLSRAELAFNTEWLRDIWQPAYGFSPDRAHVVENAIGERLTSEGSDRTLLFYGRSLLLKNGSAFRRAFARARKQGVDLALEARIVSHDKLMERMRHAHAVVVPSISDVAPNTIIDALRCGKPFLLTKYSGYAERFKDYGVIVDPLDEEDMARGMKTLADPKAYRELCARIATFKEVRSYNDVANDFLGILLSIRARERAAEGVRVLQVGSDRSRRGILFPDSAGFRRQEAYAAKFGALDIVGLSLRSDNAKESHAGGLHVYPTNSLTRLVYAFDALRMARKLPRPDVVSVQDPFETGLIGWLISRIRRAPLYVQVHTDFLSPSYRRHSLTNRIRVWIAGFMLRRAVRIRVVSERIGESIRRTYRMKTPISVLPIFADIEQVRHLEKDAALAGYFAKFPTKILVVSRLESEKNVGLAIEAFARSAPQYACLIVVGDGSRRLALKDVAKDLGIADRVFFEGEKDAAPYYTFADLVLVPSKYEGYGLVIVEALARGVPVLSTDVGVAAEVGAIVSTPATFTDALKMWFESGPRSGELKNYPYGDFDAYVRAYCDDILSCIGSQKSE